jgi:hypothetical protein
MFEMFNLFCLSFSVSFGCIFGNDRLKTLRAPLVLIPEIRVKLRDCWGRGEARHGRPGETESSFKKYFDELSNHIVT